jgi:hypothetical protein
LSADRPGCQQIAQVVSRSPRLSADRPGCQQIAQVVS